MAEHEKRESRPGAAAGRRRRRPMRVTADLKIVLTLEPIPGFMLNAEGENRAIG